VPGIGQDFGDSFGLLSSFGVFFFPLVLVAGTVWTATAHIVTAVIGSGVLALAWSVAQLGWVAGPLALAGFACVTYYTSTLLANAYRAPHPVTGDRNRTYMDAVRSYLSTSPEIGAAPALHEH